jgi:photosystem II stability/assembly factor-like uncharacterized protein
MKTEDGGTTWISIFNNDNLIIGMIDFVNRSTGWMVSYDNSGGGGMVVSKSTDGGHNWIDQYDIPEYWIRSIKTVNDTTVFVLGDTLLLKSSDGGFTWKDITVELADRRFSAFCFVNGDSGIISGYHSLNWQPVLWRTYDGGSHWQELPVAGFTGIIDLQFSNDSTGYYTANTDSGWIVVCQTRDFGENSSVILQNRKEIRSLHCLSTDLVYCMVVDTNWNYIWMKSDDGGKNWESHPSPDRGTVYALDLEFISPDTGFVIADGILLYQTTDGGDQWQINLMSYPCRDVFFLNKTKGFVCGSRRGLHFFRGDLFITRDGGETWNSILSGYEFEKCLFVNETIGFLTSRDRLYKTVDGGNKWTEHFFSDYDSTGLFLQCQDIYFTDELTGWSVGSYSDSASWGAAIFRTADGGVNWKVEMKYSDTGQMRSVNLNSIFFFNEDLGWAAGESGLFLRYDSNTNNWVTIQTQTSLPLKKVLFISELTGWIGGGYKDWTEFHPLLLKSANGGLTWTDQNLNYMVNDIYFSNPEQGWIVGADSLDRGVILATRNGGEQWQVQVSGLPAALTAIHFADGYGWAVGDQGLVLKTENGGGTWIAEDPSIFVSGYSLDQNYPNPFNPLTRIVYSLPARTPIEISIYDIQGRKVSTLINSVQAPGRYHLTWNASHHASGVYFYRMETSDYVQTRKMLLLR